MPRLYTCSFEAVAITAVQDLFNLVAPTNQTVHIHELNLFQTTDLGDAAEEVLRLRIRSGQTSDGTGGAAGTEVPLDVDDPAAGTVVRTNDATTQASGGTIVTNWVDGWNIRVPYCKIWTPETRPIIKGGRRATVEIVAAPADSITASGCITWSEG